MFLDGDKSREYLEPVRSGLGSRALETTCFNKLAIPNLQVHTLEVLHEVLHLCWSVVENAPFWQGINDTIIGYSSKINYLAIDSSDDVGCLRLLVAAGAASP